MLIKLYKTNRVRNAFICIIVIVLILNSFVVQASANNSLVDEIKKILNNYYVEDVPKEILENNSVNEIINNLNDPYTQIMDKNDYDVTVNNTYFGLGVTIKMIDMGAVVRTVMVNSPAMRSGIKEGDIIIKAGDNLLSGLSEIEAINILNGKLGVYNELKLLRKNELIAINVTLDTVYYPTVYSEIVDSNIAYLHILLFGVNTLAEFEYIINSPEMRSAGNYIIDLRNNSGGYIYSAVELAGYFAKNGKTAIFQNKNGEKFTFNSIGKGKAIDKPTIFLVNESTASAAELLVACAQDYGTATIIGKKTYGKGVAQSAFKLSDGNIFKTTTLKMYSPKGRDISNGGISPDIYINEIDSLFAGILLAKSSNKNIIDGMIAEISISNKNYYISLANNTNKNYLEAYRQIISQASAFNVSNFLQLSQNSKDVNSKYPILKYAEVPKTKYKVGDRVAFKLNAPNYNNLVQYRAMLWDETTNKYVDIWNTNDRYYDHWKPKGKDVFTISFPITKIGNYKIKVFIKRSGISNARTLLKGMNCDSYVYEVPFKVINK